MAKKYEYDAPVYHMFGATSHMPPQRPYKIPQEPNSDEVKIRAKMNTNRVYTNLITVSHKNHQVTVLTKNVSNNFMLEFLPWTWGDQENKICRACHKL